MLRRLKNMRRIAVIATSIMVSSLAIALVVVAIKGGPTRAFQPNTARAAVLETSPDDPGGRTIPSWVWQDPFSPEAVTVANAADADLSFDVDVPDGLQQPAKIVASTDGTNSVIAWVYDDPDLGPFILDEQVEFFTQAQFEKSVGSPVQIIRGGTRALLVQNEQVIAVEWLEALTNVAQGLLEGKPPNAVLEVELVAPANGKMSADQLLGLANKV
jgi:hypothetical protein